MKTYIKLIVKFMLLTYLLFISPFFNNLYSFISIEDVFSKFSIYNSTFSKDTFSVADKMNLMYVDENVFLSNSEIETVKTEKENSKKVYIYNTHQQEEYLDGKGVIDASIVLANKLQKEGIQVVYENNDFNQYLNSQGLDYNYSYQASSHYLSEAIKKHSNFDLIIDFHRDALPRESSYIEIENKAYAKMMFVVGAYSKNVNSVVNISNALTNIIEEKKPGIMKSVLLREAYYNQDMSNKMCLIEVGGNKNHYEEVVNSTNILANAIIQYLSGE